MCKAMEDAIKERSMQYYAEGMEKGEQRGIEKGEQKGTYNLLKKLVTDKVMTVKEAANFGNVPEDKLAELLAEQE